MPGSRSCSTAMLLIALATGCSDAGRQIVQLPPDSLPEPAADFALAERDCKEFTVDDARFSANVTLPDGVGLRLDRASGWKFPDIRRGMFVGQVTNTDGGATRLFSDRVQLDPGQGGCLRFRLVRQAGGLEAPEAVFYRAPGRGRPTKVLAAICWHGPHDEDVKPRLHAFPADCDVVYAVAVMDRSAVAGWPAAPDTVMLNVRLAERLGPGVPATDTSATAYVTAELGRRLRELHPAMDSDMIGSATTAFSSRLFGIGLWFPCVFTGCCRAY